MPNRLNRLSELLVGLSVPTALIGFVIWRAPPLDLPWREIGIVVAIAAVGFLAFLWGNFLGKRDEKWLRWIGGGFTGLALVILAALFVGGLGLIVWAKFNAPSSDCMRCD